MAKGKHAPAKGAVRENKVLHPKSRKVTKLRTKEQRKLKLANKQSVGCIRLQILGDKLLWFHDNLLGLLTLKEGEEVVDESDMLTLALAYLARFEDELEQIQLKNSIGNHNKRKHQHSSRLDAIRLTQKTEEEEFNGCGLELPDLCDRDSLKQFLAWNGELRFVQNLKTRRFTRSSLEASSSVKEENESMATE